MTAIDLIMRLREGNYHERGYGLKLHDLKNRHRTTIALGQRTAVVYTAQVVDYLRVFGRSPVRLSIAKGFLVIRIVLDGGRFKARFNTIDPAGILGSQVCKLR